MTAADRWYEGGTDPGPAVPIDTTVAHQARVYDYWLGGSENFRADRLAAQKYLRAVPVIRDGVRAQRAFMQRAVGYLAAEAGIRQFLDIGTGLPTSPNVHEVAPDARVVYVDNDPIVLAHARALLDSGPGRTAFLEADLRDTETILSETPRLLDFRKPIGLLLIGILQLISEDDNPGLIVRRLLDAVPSGSWLAIVQPTADVPSEDLRGNMTRATTRLSESSAVATTLRDRAAILSFFDGTELLEPGVVQLHRWRPLPGSTGLEANIPAYGGLGCKP